MAHISDERPVRDFVVPLCNLEIDADRRALQNGSNLAGTAFLIGDRGFALTAAHVIDQTVDHRRYALVATKEGERSVFHAVKVLEAEKHPTEDVAAFEEHQQDVACEIEKDC